MATKKPTAAQLRARKLFAERARAGTLKRRKNPAAKKVIRRAGVSKTAYVKRPSQATRAAPTKRLVARRRKVTSGRAPAGYFPNPHPHFGIKVNGGNDRNGNPRRGWIVVEIHGENCDVHDFVTEGYRGPAALEDAGYHKLPTIGVFNVTAREFAAFEKQYGK